MAPPARPPSTTGAAARSGLPSFSSSSRPSPRLKSVGALAGLCRVEPSVGLAGLLLQLELLGAVIPVADLLGQPGPDRCVVFAMSASFRRAPLRCPHDVGHRVSLRLLFQPRSIQAHSGRARMESTSRSFAGQRPVIKIGA